MKNQKIIDWMNKKGFTDSSLARALGVTQPCVGKYKEGGMPRLDVAYRWLILAKGSLDLVDMIPEGKQGSVKVKPEKQEEMEDL